MAGDGRDDRDSVIARLRAEPYRFSFDQAVRILELRQRGKKAVGEGGDPRAEAIAFSSEVGLTFPPSEIVDLHPPESEGKRDLLTVAFLGLAGITGPLPMPFTEQIIERMRVRDMAGRDFLDLFNHRLLSLLVRLRRQLRPELRTDPPWESPQGGVFAAVIGLATPHLRGRLGVPDSSLLHFTGLLAQSRRSQSGLETLLGGFFGMKVSVAPMQGEWESLSPCQWTVLGGAGRNCSLGVDAVLGTRIWDQGAGIAVAPEPLDLAVFRRFLPEKPGFLRMAALVDFYTRREAAADLVLRLEAAQVPPSRLDAAGDTLLGLTSWLGTGARDKDGEVRLRLSSGLEAASP